MFARGVISLHTAHLPVPKNLASKSRVSITSKLIETKGLQVLHFGHLRKTGGRGSYQLVHTAYLPLRKPHGTESKVSAIVCRLTADSFALNPFLSHHSKTRAHNFFCLISLHKTGRILPAWSYQVSSVLAKGCRLMANGCLTCCLKGAPVSV
jgi:hypothetical protein